MNPRGTPRFSLAQAIEVAATRYGLAGAASALPSERDQNFLLRTANGEKFVLKFANSDEEPSTLEFQNAALDRVARCAPELAVPRLRPALDGAPMLHLAGPDGRQHYCRMIGWLEGMMYAEVPSPGATLLASLGAVLARLDAALQGFSHAGMHRELHWDVRHADRALRHLPLLPAAQQATVSHFMARWARIDWRVLRTSVIHGDANEHNVLVRDGRVAGLIDFGDIVHSALPCDLAIALAYAMQGQDEPLTAAACVAAAYQERLPLAADEVDALEPLLAARLCMSVCYAAYNARAKQDDPYQQVSAGPAWDLLQRLAAQPPGALRTALHRACGHPEATHDG